MLNIGRVGADAIAYYVDSVAPSTSDYYFGRGEAAGRWTGSLAPELGLCGSVEREHFERILAGLHPHTGGELITAAGSNARSRARSASRAAAARPGAEALDVAQVAAQLQVSTRAVRHWLEAGEEVKQAVRDRLESQANLLSATDLGEGLDRLIGAGLAGIDLPRTYLFGEAGRPSQRQGRAPLPVGRDPGRSRPAPPAAPRPRSQGGMGPGVPTAEELLGPVGRRVRAGQF